MLQNEHRSASGISLALPCFSENLKAPRELEIPGLLNMVAQGWETTTTDAQPAIALGWSKQNWVEIVHSAGRERPGTCVLELTVNAKGKAAGWNKSNPLIRLQAEVRPGDAGTDRVPEMGQL